MSRARVLVTGFGPFPGVPHNPTQPLVEALGRTAPRSVRTLVLPTTWDCARLTALCCAADMVLMFGVSARSRRIRYERLALPRTSASADAFDHTPVAAPARRAASALPVWDLVHRARRAGFPVAASANAGAYVCNAAYGAALGVNRNTLFVHVPMPRRFGASSEARLLDHAEWLLDQLVSQPVGLTAPLRRSRASAVGRPDPRASAASSR